MLDKVIRKAYHKAKAVDNYGRDHDLKLINFIASGTKTGKLDRQCIVDKNTIVTPGLVLTLPDNSEVIVSYKQADVYKNDIIRYTLDCTEVNIHIDVKRAVLIKSNQGGLAGKYDSIVYNAMPAKVGLLDVKESKLIDHSTPKFLMFTSILFELEVGDELSIPDTTFESAKINSLVHITPGLLEIEFDRDPRWPS